MVSTTTARSLMSATINDNSSGDVTPADVRSVFSATLDALDLAASGGNIDLTLGQISGTIDTPLARTYIVELMAPFPYTITHLAHAVGTGSLICSVMRSGANVLGLTSISVTTMPTLTESTGNNSVSVGNKVLLALSSISEATDFTFSLRFTRT